MEVCHHALDRIEDGMKQRHAENTSSLKVLEKDLKVVMESVDDFAKGFSGGNWEGHRLYHEAVIKKMEGRAKLYEDLRSELAKKGMWALLVLIGIALWQYLKTKVVP